MFDKPKNVEEFVQNTLESHKQFGRPPIRFMQMIRRHGLIPAIIKSVRNSTEAEGFKRVMGNPELRRWCLEQAILTFPKRFRKVDKDIVGYAEARYRIGRALYRNWVDPTAKEKGEEVVKAPKIKVDRSTASTTSEGTGKRRGRPKGSKIIDGKLRLPEEVAAMEAEAEAAEKAALREARRVAREAKKAAASAENVVKFPKKPGRKKAA